MKALTGGLGVDVVYDGVGGDDITVESMRSCKFGARLLIVGWAATPNVAAGKGERGTGAPNPNRIPTNLITYIVFLLLRLVRSSRLMVDVACID